ncbi:hypothetical protein BKA69DRAFT_486482 [Paraphysoderma sedebokerense]|nr:hypothetical protein BKA69DRAFT_486482 [Paraphysoderma sedebokerense]
MPKKKFIDKKASRHYQLVHRSQRDPLTKVEGSSPYVLKPVLPSPNLKKLLEKDPNAVPNPYEVDENLKSVVDLNNYTEEDDWGSDYSDGEGMEYSSSADEAEQMIENLKIDDGNGRFDDVEEYDEEHPSVNREDKTESANGHFPPLSRKPKVLTDEESRAGKAALYGIFYDDTEYDYTQHLKDIGESPGAVFISSESKREKQKSVTFIDDEPAPVNPNPSILSAADVKSADLSEFLDLPEDVKEVLYALEDDNFETEFDDEWVVQLKSDAPISSEVTEDEAEQELDWTKAGEIDYKKYQSDDSDEEFEEEEEELSRKGKSEKGRRGSWDEKTSFSMSSSAMFRNDQLKLLDNQFEKVCICSDSWFMSFL